MFENEMIFDIKVFSSLTFCIVLQENLTHFVAVYNYW